MDSRDRRLAHMGGASHSETLLRAIGAGSTRRLVASILSIAAAWQAQAAGGHHAVDDAAILEPSQCLIEAWADRESGGGRTLLHLGPACRVGAVELGLNFDRTHGTATDSVTAVGPQIKWARALDEHFSAGVVAWTAWIDRSPGHIGSTVVIPLTWQPVETVLVHLNAGRDFRRHDDDRSRVGAALEWAPLPAWLFVVERFRESRTDFWRMGARWAVTPSLYIDLSRACGVGGSAPSWATLGASWVFDH
jgi:hypothetical protein